jgi:hypothetical protein
LQQWLRCRREQQANYWWYEESKQQT